VAVARELVLRDRYVADIGDEDVRVSAGGWVYYVRAVKRPKQLLRSDANAGSSSLLGDLLFALVWGAVMERLDRRRPWLIGVVRMGDVATWNDITPRVVHTEALAPGGTIAGAIEHLATAAATGRFAP
jgi:hypothetical protein